jgi:precorrin-2 dehydrogenase/sirohydrochlorin ferrochelatase
MFPLFLDLTDRLCVVVGGGPVGRRKAAALFAAGARLRLVCLEPEPADFMQTNSEWIAAPYEARYLTGASLVIAAASAEVNRQVAADAQARGLWVNAATEPRQGDFFLPAVIRRGELVLAVASGGLAPGLTREVRCLLESELDDAFGHWLTLVAELRPRIQARSQDLEARRILMQRLCRPGWLERIRQHGIEEVRAAMEAELES